MNYMKRIDNLIGSTPVAAVCNAAGQVDEILRIALGLDPNQIGAVGGGGGDHIQAYPGS